MKLHNDTIDDIIKEIAKIDDMFVTSKHLMKKYTSVPIGFIEISSIGCVLHSYYTGIEKIITLIFQDDQTNVHGKERWHLKLLDRAFELNDDGKSVFQNEIKKKSYRLSSIQT